MALLALASAAASANPNGTEEAQGTRVSYEDLDLNTFAGASILYYRIELAARQVCETDKDLIPQEPKNACYRMAIAAAVAKVDNPWLTAIHHTKTRGPRLVAPR